MPQPFNAAVMTTDGEALLAKATAGQCRIAYVCMAVGNGAYSNAEKTIAALKERKALKSKKNEYSFSDVTIENKNCVTLTALITNQNPVTSETLVGEGYYINEVGIFAKEQGEDDATAILYSICITASANGNGDFMPPYNGFNRAEITQNYMITVDNSAEITVQMKGAALLAEDANQVTDDTTKTKYKIGINDGIMYYQEASGEDAEQYQVMILDTEAMETAFKTVFGTEPSGDSDSLSLGDITDAIRNVWDGASSTDADAMSANDVNDAVNTTWNGESSTDSEALNAEDVESATK